MEIKSVSLGSLPNLLIVKRFTPFRQPISLQSEIRKNGTTRKTENVKLT